MRTIARLARLLRGRASDEHGTVLVIVAGCMVLFLSAGAYTIDLGSGRQAETKAQSAADAAALAAADTLAACTDTTTACAASATTAAVSIAQSNGLPSGTCVAGGVGLCVTAPYNNNPYMAKVTEVVNSNSTFGNRSGGSALQESASSIANGTRTTSTTVTPVTSTVSGSTTSTSTTVITTPGTNAVVFTGSKSCSALNLANLNGVTINGLITNGGWANGGSNNSTVSALQYNSGACTAPSGSGVNVRSTSTDDGTLTYPIDLRQASQTISCPNTNSYNSNGSSGPSGTVTESQSSGDTYNYSVSYLKFMNSENVGGIYCANTIDLTNSATLTSTAPTIFIANNFGGGGVSDTGTLSTYTSGAYKNVLLWMTGSGTQQINSTSFLNGNTIFAPIGGIYLNSNALNGGTQSFFIEASTFQTAGANNGTWQVPSSISGGTTSTSTSTTTIPTTSTTVSSSTSTSTGSGVSALTG
jgi:Flp pilus assembly protein TadG